MSEGIYRKVFVRMWKDRKIRALSPMPPSGTGLWLLLLAGEHTSPIPGLLSVGRAGFAESIGWSLEDFDRCFTEIETQGLAVADWEQRLIWLPSAWGANGPDNPNMVKGYGPLWREYIPECDLSDRALAALREHCEERDRQNKKQSFTNAFNETFGRHAGKPKQRVVGATGNHAGNVTGNVTPNPGGNQKQEAGAGTGESEGRARAREKLSPEPSEHEQPHEPLSRSRGKPPWEPPHASESLSYEEAAEALSRSYLVDTSGPVAQAKALFDGPYRQECERSNVPQPDWRAPKVAKPFLRLVLFCQTLEANAEAVLREAMGPTNRASWPKLGDVLGDPGRLLQDSELGQLEAKSRRSATRRLGGTAKDWTGDTGRTGDVHYETGEPIPEVALGKPLLRYQDTNRVRPHDASKRARRPVAVRV